MLLKQKKKKYMQNSFFSPLKTAVTFGEKKSMIPEWNFHPTREPCNAWGVEYKWPPYANEGSHCFYGFSLSEERS